MTERADPLGGSLDLSGFKPMKPESKVPAAAIRKVAAAAKFPSREPGLQEEEGKAKPRAERRVYRTGRNAHFSCKADPEVVERFYAICNRSDWVMGETLDRAVQALERELAGQG